MKAMQTNIASNQFPVPVIQEEKKLWALFIGGVRQTDAYPAGRYNILKRMKQDKESMNVKRVSIDRVNKFGTKVFN